RGWMGPPAENGDLSMRALQCSLLCLPLLWGCGSMADHPAASSASPPAAGQTAAAQPASTTSFVPAPAPTRLDPSRGQNLGIVFESYMSPWQQEAEESDTPSAAPAEFKS